MAKLLMITGLGSAKDLASGKRGAFYNTLEEFHKYWERIDIICPKIQNSKLKIFENVYIHISPWPLVFHPIWFLKKGLEIYKQQKFDLMVVHEFPPFYNGIGARLLWQKIKIPYILEIMHIPGFPKSADFKEDLYKNLVKWFIKYDAKKAKKVRVINQKQTPDFLVDSGINRNNIIYIPAMYIDLDVFHRTNVEKKYDFVFAARLEKNKGIGELLKAVVILKNHKPDTKLLIIGNGQLKNKLIKFITDNKLSDNVFFSGWLATSNDMAKAYSEARIFVNPSYNEGGPRVVLEAMACGLPIITTRVGLMPDVIDNGRNGLFVDWSGEDMAEKISCLLKNKELQNKFSQAGLETVGQFERRSTIKNYADKLKELM